MRFSGKLGGRGQYHIAADRVVARRRNRVDRRVEVQLPAVEPEIKRIDGIILLERVELVDNVGKSGTGGQMKRANFGVREVREYAKVDWPDDIGIVLKK
jgi:hypothetical protein